MKKAPKRRFFCRGASLSRLLFEKERTAAGALFLMVWFYPFLSDSGYACRLLYAFYSRVREASSSS
jgi:hypothetical protein